MSNSAVVRWTVGLSAAVAGVFAFAVVRLQQPLSEADVDGPQTYCYQGVRTHDDEQPTAQCFTYGEFLHSVDSFGAPPLMMPDIEEDESSGASSHARSHRCPTAAGSRRPSSDLLPADIPDVPGGDIIREHGMEEAAFVSTAMAKLNEVGVVGMHDAGVFPNHLELYADMAGPPQTGPVRSGKLFADGDPRQRGSAMIEHYSDRPETSGSLLVNATTLTNLAKSWAPLATRSTSTPSATSPTDSPSTPSRPPSSIPTHATSDMKYAELRLGPERTATEAYRMRFLDIGPVLGSDFPVEPPNPFEGIFAAVARKSPATGRGVDGSLDGWHVEEALSLDEALLGFTRGPALPLDALEIDDLRSLKVKQTWVGGRMVYEYPGGEGLEVEDL
ncbi:amidohydrolase family protein [Verticillium dahliae]|nr:amidohydrolase family protein [Verticillium dahliae]